MTRPTARHRRAAARSRRAVARPRRAAARARRAAARPRPATGGSRRFATARSLPAGAARSLAVAALAAAALACAAPAHAGTYEHRALSPGSAGADGWSPRVSTVRGWVATAIGDTLSAHFWNRNPFDPGDLADWSYTVPDGTTAVAWEFEREVAGLGGGDWNTLFSAVTDGRSRHVAWDVPSVNRP